MAGDKLGQVALGLYAASLLFECALVPRLLFPLPAFGTFAACVMMLVAAVKGSRLWGLAGVAGLFAFGAFLILVEHQH